MKEEMEALFRQADALYTQIYNARQAGFIRTNVGSLGIYGRTELSESQQARIAQLTKERSKIYSKARRLQKQLAQQ